MKVKVAEALSYGLGVVGSHHALIGYEEASAFCIEADDSDSFVEGILRLVSEDAPTRESVKRGFSELYTLQRSARDFLKVAQSLTKSA